MRLPLVAVIGRPNVGKSTFVNRLVGSRRAIVDDLPGVTRDRAYYDAEWLTFKFSVVDTGGLMPGEADRFANQVNDQVEIAIEEADVVIFLVDGQAGITPWDEDIAKLIRNSNKPVLLTVNKIDTRELMGHTAEFYGLGLGEPYPISAMHGTVGVGDLLDKLIETFKGLDNESLTMDAIESESIRIAFVGRPNVGKSSLVNKLLGTERTIVSEVAGTTRDAIDTDIEWSNEKHSQKFTLVDTAGIRKKAKVEYGVELFSVDRALKSVKRSDITVLVIDAIEGITDQDKRMVETSGQYGKGLLIVMNKWDLVPDKDTNTTKKFENDIIMNLPHARFAPFLFVSAVTGQRLDRIFELAIEIYENNHRRIKTSVVNQLLMEAHAMTAPPPVKGKRLKIYYGTQVDIAPPTFLLFVNSDKLLNEAYRRYLEHHLRKNIEFKGSPLVLACRNKPEREAKK